jgi:murein DD-endopeptidase MepM/ murein hydrolase activator NlpD
MVQQFKAAAKAMPTQELQNMATNMSKLAAAQGLAQDPRPWVQLKYILGGTTQQMLQTAKNAKEAGDQTKQLGSALDGLPRAIDIKISGKEAIQIAHDAMSATQDDMVQSAQDAFNSRWDATMSAAQAAFDKKQQAMQNRQQNASDALQRRQQAAQDAMDKKFQKHEDAINKRYQDRIDAVNKEIKAEQDADAQRQKMYEAEKKRMQDLADMANKNIDFNTAVNEGNFDEAAKIRNDMEAQSAANAMDQIEARRSARVQQAVDRLQKKIDNLEKMRDKELKHLQNVEDVQKKHLERMQEAESKALEKSQAAQSAALQKQEDAEMASMQRRRDMEEANLNQRLDLFKTYVAKNQKDLERWMKKVGLTYNDFGADIKAKGESWASYFQKALHDHIIAGAMQVTSDDMWAKITPKLAGKLLKGLGFASLNAFQKFVNTGRLKQETRGGGKKNLDFQHHRHGGGMIGSPLGRNNRKGLRGYGSGGMHPSEVDVRAQKGEYIVNKKAAGPNRALLDHINSGSGGYKKMVGYGGSRSVLPLSGYPAAMMANGFMLGTEAATRSAMRNYKSSAISKISSGFLAGPGGKHRPVPAGIGLTQGLHDQSTGYAALDFAAPLNTPAYAVANGTITRSEAITSGGSPGNGLYSTPYTSYGNVIYLKTDGGPTVLYAHLNKRMVAAGKRVKGGSRIGLTGNTGNSTGPHLHFGDSDGNPYEFLRKGGEVRFDNTHAILHKGETVLTDKLTKKFKDNVASGGNVVYDVGGVQVIGSNLDPDDVADAVINKLEKREARKPRSRRNRDND